MSPTELLDYLASRFVEQGWSIKGMIKHLVLSKTFQQSSVTPEASVRADPANRLLSHFPVRRLEAESIRDAILTRHSSPTLLNSSEGRRVWIGRCQPRNYGTRCEPSTLGLARSQPGTVRR